MVVYILPPNAKTLLGLFCNSNCIHLCSHMTVCSSLAVGRTLKKVENHCSWKKLECLGSMIFHASSWSIFTNLQNVSRFSGDSTHQWMISSKTANFNAQILNLVIFFWSSEFFCLSADFCKKGCGSTAQATVVVLQFCFPRLKSITLRSLRITKNKVRHEH